MSNKNYESGHNYENRVLANLEKSGDFVKGGRFYASKGIADIWWVSKDGQHNEAQCKFSSVRKPYISKAEKSNLRKFARKTHPQIRVFLYMKQSRKPETVERIR